MATTADLACGMLRGMRSQGNSAIPELRHQGVARPGAVGWRCLRRIHLRPGEAGTLPQPAESTARLYRRALVVEVAGRRSAGAVRQDRRANVRNGRADVSGKDKW